MSCAMCLRHERAREASRAQLEALWQENERLAAELARAQQAAAGVAGAGAANADEAAADAEAEAGPAPGPARTAARSSSSRTPLPDVLCGGDGRLPRRLLARARLASAAGAPPAAASKMLAAALLCLRAPARLLVLAASADRRLALWDAARAHARAAPRPLAAAQAASPLLSLSGAILIGDAADEEEDDAEGGSGDAEGDGDAGSGGDSEDAAAEAAAASLPASPCALFVGGHVDGAVSLWAVLRAPAAPRRWQLRLQCLAVHAGAHSKFVTRTLEAAPRLRAAPGARTLALTTSSDGTVAVWAVEMAAVAAALAVATPASASLRQLQLLSFSAAPTSAAWRPPRAAAALGTRGLRAPVLASFVVAVDGAPYLFYFDIVGEGDEAAAAPCALLLRRVPLSEDGPEVFLEDDAAASSGVSTASRLPLMRAPAAAGGGRTPIPAHHPDASAIHLPVSGTLDVVPVGFSVVDLAAAEQGAPLRVPVASLLAAATNSGLVLLSAWGSNRVLRRFAGHLASISPTFVSATASLSAAALRVQWLPQPAAAADAPALYLLASTDAGDAVAVFSLASGRVVTTLDAVDDDAQHASADNYSPRSPRTSLRCLTVVADRTGLARGPLLLTLDNTSTVTLRACE